MSQRRKMPTVATIKRTWARWLIRVGKIKSVAEADRDFCWVCGFDDGMPMERAHILARSAGGNDTPDNIHMLCGRCHAESEWISGGLYFLWFMADTNAARAKITEIATQRWEKTGRPYQ